MTLSRFLRAAVLGVSAAALCAGGASAYFYRDGKGGLQTMLSFVCQTTQVCPGLVVIDSSGNEKATAANPLSQKFGSMAASGSSNNQFGLAVSTNTVLTVPPGAVCAQITVEGANVRRTSDGSAPSASRGTLIQAGQQWQDCGPLAAYRFAAVSGSPTLDVEYFQ